MKIPPVKGTRDFYPDLMGVHNWIGDIWRGAALRAGFQEYDGPIFESLQLFTEKSGDEIVGQLYTLEDHGGRQLAMRPEMTPTLARMIAERQQSLPRPIKWFSVGRFYRYEKPQRGRLREFFQWNVDILGSAETSADAEVISVALDALSDMGLTPDDIELRLGSRRLLAALLTDVGVPGSLLAKIYAVADKRSKVPAEALTAKFAELGLDPSVLDSLLALMACHDMDQVERFVADRKLEGVADPLAEVRELVRLIEAFGKGPFVRFDLGVVRGLAYYTGPVFEIFDRQAELRSVFGGGRYDNLLGAMGGAAMPAVGFGMGDVVLGELLAERGLLPEAAGALDDYVVPVGQAMLEPAIRLTQALRRQGRRAQFSLKAQAVGKQMRRANDLGAERVIVVGPDEWAAGQVQVRDMRAGTQEQQSIESVSGGPLS